ncbi:triphosphoribosyl-dephospho-CoA synthase [Streptococcus rupicaprae]|uniref:Probable 2-(5''-triphosphoribosyl)-3'-dephosphocoenzyme-A synthase n=1 Tax=Streptococcus rupicaprae TaxID=759619 RepID=A0ABV2FGB1_9STRE
MVENLSSIARFATNALIYEVSLSPKPGLVDHLNNGSHHDMDFDLFMASTTSLKPYFQLYLEAGFSHKGEPEALFDPLRRLGIEAEKAMFQATQGINTHKGANFSFALILGATGAFLRQTSLSFPLTASQSEQILEMVSQISFRAMERDFNTISADNPSYGERLYLEHGFRGIRGEAATGYPSLKNLLLPALRKDLKQYSSEEAFHRALLLSMSQIEDGNLIHRGGIEGWRAVKEDCQEALKNNLSPQDLYQWLTEYDAILRSKHLSPGGTADLIALTYYFMQLEGLIT